MFSDVLAEGDYSTEKFDIRYVHRKAANIIYILFRVTSFE